MNKIIFSKTDSKGTMNIVAGDVSNVFAGTGEATGRLTKVSMTVPVYDRENKVEVKKYLTLNCWNSEDGTKPLADWALKAIKKGDFIAFLTSAIKDEGEPASDGTPRIQASVIDFQRNRRWSFIDENKSENNERNVIVSRVGSVKEKEGKVILRLPLDVWDEKEQNTVTQWVSVSYKNGAAKAVAKLVKGTPIAIVGGRLYENQDASLGETFRNMAGFDFATGYYEKKAGGPAPAQQAPAEEESDFAELDMDDGDLPF
jgi:hypothetical protein